jgi:glycosyltransferase involved in cell wall biosynthesis
VAGWAQALMRLDGDAVLRADLVARGRERAAGFTWERAAQAHVDLFRAATE